MQFKYLFHMNMFLRTEIVHNKWYNYGEGGWGGTRILVIEKPVAMSN